LNAIKKRDLKTPWLCLKTSEIAFPRTRISKFSRGGGPRTPYRGPPSVVLISNPLLWNPRSAPVFRIIKVSVIILNITKTSSKICLCMSYLVNDDDGAISESSAISWPMKKLARCSDVRLLQLLRLELLPRSKRSSVNINKNK